MSATSSPPPTLNSHEQALVHYRSISRLSLVALGLGLASALVLVSPLLAVVPLSAVAVAVLSLREIRSSGDQVVGRTPAIAGLCLATLFLGFGLSARFTRALTLEVKSREFAEAWLELVAQGDLQQADQLRMPVHNRMRSPQRRQEFYEKNPEALADMKSFFAAPPLGEFVALGKEVRFQFDSVTGSVRSARFDQLTLRYNFGKSADGNGPQRLLISVKRQRDADYLDWSIENVSKDAGS